METSFLHFIEARFWIDVLLIVCMLGLCITTIMFRSKKILAKNHTYNAELLAMRTEIYTEYEKNFFL